MRQAGEVTYADTHKGRKNEGVIEFRQYSDMKRALEKLDGTEVNGRKIRLIEDRPGAKRRRSYSRSRSRSRSESQNPCTSAYEWELLPSEFTWLEQALMVPSLLCVLRSRSRNRRSRKSRSRSESSSRSRSRSR